jgi:hypothetical protein
MENNQQNRENGLPRENAQDQRVFRVTPPPSPDFHAESPASVQIQRENFEGILDAVVPFPILEGNPQPIGIEVPQLNLHPRGREDFNIMEFAGNLPLGVHSPGVQQNPLNPRELDAEPLPFIQRRVVFGEPPAAPGFNLIRRRRPQLQHQNNENQQLDEERTHRIMPQRN